jgi:transposase InsO family protein
LTALGRLGTPILLGILDDRSRLCCHLQWYLSESAEALVHGLSQAFQERGLPRAILWDNGAAMRAEEVLEGLRNLPRLGGRVPPLRRPPARLSVILSSFLAPFVICDGSARGA